MALVKCPECNKEVSDQAHNCPHCGYPLKKATKHVGQRNPDFSKMEVIATRNYVVGIVAAVLIFFFVSIFIGIGILMLKVFPDIEGRIFAIICFSLAPLFFVVGIVQLVKGINNTKIKQHCLYYDKKDEVFYLLTWQRTIVAIDAYDDLRIGMNKRGFGEIVAVHQGRRINLGFSATNYRIANQRVIEIRSSLK